MERENRKMTQKDRQVGAGAASAVVSPRRSLTAVLVVGCASLLSGCLDQDKSDLDRYVEDVLARKGGRIDELPPIEPYVVYTYKGGEVDPFAPFFEEEPPPPPGIGAGLRPDLDRNREELEQYALDSLRMMGTLEREGTTWAIVRSPDSIIHRIAVGNYIGKNHGKIIGIFEDRIELKEIIPDGQGGFSERDAALALLE
jgi:type IV pilus assembly protein PilP